MDSILGISRLVQNQQELRHTKSIFGPELTDAVQLSPENEEQWNVVHSRLSDEIQIS